MTFDLVLCGVGGQGVLTTAYVLDNAAVDAGLYLKQPEVHGMAQRGGAVCAQLRLSDSPVKSDLISTGGANLIMSVEPMEALRYLSLLSPQGWVVTDVTPLRNTPDYPPLNSLYEVLFGLPRLLVLDATFLAASAGVLKGQNMVVLGAASGWLPLPLASLEKHLCALFRPKGERVVEANLRAFRLGFSAGGFLRALLERGVAPSLVAQVTARLAFDVAPVSETVVASWADALTGPNGVDIAKRAFLAAKPFAVDKPQLVS